jgi:dolichol-phosphate mannosyltransferase/undecaprenyl-phosphate 4-deoxy-4-formamido-L-arabinose transferase
MKKNYYSIVIPVYNSSKTINELCSRIVKTFSKIGSDYEVILVDDGSKDDSWEKIVQLNSKNGKIKAIKLMKNFGQQNAVFCGFNFVSGDYVITLDDDLQHAPEDIPLLIKKIQETKADIVIGELEHTDQGMVRRLGRKLLNHINRKVFSIPSNLKMSSFRIIRRPVIDEVITRNTINPTIGPLLLSVSNKAVNVKVNLHERKFGKSGYSFYKLAKLTIDTLANNSVLPLRAASSAGCFASTVAIVVAVYLIWHRLHSHVMPGWTSLIVINLFFFGLILSSMGVIGEYLIRILHQVKNYPPYIIREKIGK